VKCIVEVLIVCAIGLGATGAALGQGAPSVGSLLGMVRDQLAQQGQLSYAGTTHDSSNNSTWVNKFTVQASNIVIDEQQCTISFHWHTTTDGKVVADDDVGVPFRMVTSISTISMAEDISNAEVSAGHGTWATSFKPQVWVVHVARSDGKSNAVDFKDQATANTAASEMKQVMSMCR
jgi:hypothetical protein